MDNFMSLPEGVIETLVTNELVLIKGGKDGPVEFKPANNSSGVCSGTNNGDGSCGGTNNGGGKCG